MKGAILLFTALALLPPLASAAGEPFLVVDGTRAVSLALAALSLDLILGYGGLVSFGHAAFLGIGAYAAAILPGADLVVQMAAAILACAAFALVTGAISLRTSGIGFIMITLAFGQMAFFAAVSLSSFGGDNGTSLPGRPTLLGTGAIAGDTGLYYVALTCLAAAFVLLDRVVGSRFGRALRGARDNPARTESIGLHPFRFRLVAYVIAGSLAGVAGVLLAAGAGFVSPALMSWQRSGELIVTVVLGGQGTLLGPVLGALVFLALETGLGHLSVHWRFGLGAFLVLLVLFGRGGLLGLLARRRAPA